MKHSLIIILLLLYANGYSQEYPYIGWNNILLHRTIEDLNKSLRPLEDENSEHQMKNYLLITEDGGVIQSMYINQYLYNQIPFNYLEKKSFFNNNFLKKLLNRVQEKYIYFLKSHIYKINNNIYIAFDQCFVTMTDNKKIFIKKIKTYALYGYIYNETKGDYTLEIKELFKP